MLLTSHRLELPMPVLSTCGVKTDERIARIRNLDLSKVGRGLKKMGWDKERIDNAVKWYRRFMEMVVKYPDVRLVPGVDIDDAWHQHIINTKDYARDCAGCVGYFMHHTPYGHNEREMAWLDRNYKLTHRLYMAEYGEIPPFQEMARCNSCVDCYVGG